MRLGWGRQGTGRSKAKTVDFDHNKLVGSFVRKK